MNPSQKRSKILKLFKKQNYPEVSKINNSVMKKKLTSLNSVFSQKRDFRKTKTDLSSSKMESLLFLLLSTNNITPIDESCYKIFDTSILQETFSSVSKT